MRIWLTITAGAVLASLVMAQADTPKAAKTSGLVVDAQDGHALNRVNVCFKAEEGTIERCIETDAQGRFLLDLPSATYWYYVHRAGYFSDNPLSQDLPAFVTLRAGDSLRDIKLRMRRTGSIAGRVVYADGEPFADVSVGLSREQGPTITNDIGEYRFGNLTPGDYTVQAVTRNPARDCEATPNTKRSFIAESAGNRVPLIRVESGLEARLPDIVMVEVHPVRVKGRVVWPGSPPSSELMYISLRGTDNAFTRFRVNDSDGSFSICGVTPGDYSLQLYGRVQGRIVRAALPVGVKDRDIEDLKLTAEISAVIHGRIEVEDDPKADLSGVTALMLGSRRDLDYLPGLTVLPDHTFKSEEVYTDEYRFGLGGLPPGSYVKSITLDGREFIDAPMTIQSGETIENLVFTVSRKAGALDGVVRDEAGKAVPEAIVLVLPDPRHLDLDLHRRLGNTDQNGSFKYTDLAPGKYRVSAWRKFPDAGWEELMRQNGVSGTAVDIPESGHVSIVLTAR